MKVAKIALLMLAMMVGITSCGGSDEPTLRQTFTTVKSYLAVTETDHYTTTLFENSESAIEVNIGRGGDLSISNFRLRPTEVPSLLKITDLSYSVGKKDELILNGENKPVTLNGAATNLVAESVKVTIYSGINTDMFFDVQIDLGDYYITKPYSSYTMTGETRVQNSGGSGIYTDSEIGYEFKLNPTNQTVDIYLSGAKFDVNMPHRMDMVFPSLPVTFKSTGFTIDDASCIPTIGGTPYPSYAVSDVNFELRTDPSVPSILRFKVTNSHIGEYDVIVPLFY